MYVGEESCRNFLYFVERRNNKLICRIRLERVDKRNGKIDTFDWCNDTEYTQEKTSACAVHFSFIFAGRIIY